MIAKITSGYSFKHAVKYVLDEKKDAKLLYAEGVRIVDDTDNRDRITESFRIQADLNSRTKKSVGHIALSFSIEDKTKIDDTFMVKVTKEYLWKMGIKDTQLIMVRHFDKQHPHIHILYNRINNFGKTISDSNERRRSTKISRELTEKYGLHVSKGKVKVNIQRLQEPDKSKYEIYEALKSCIGKCKSWDELEKMLKRHGIEVRFKHKGQTNEVQGVIFTKNGYSHNGSKVDKQYSYSKISKQLTVNSFSQRFSNGRSSADVRSDSSYQSKEKDLIESVLDGLSSVSVPSQGDNFEEDLFIQRMENEDKRRRYKNNKKKKGRSL